MGKRVAERTESWRTAERMDFAQAWALEGSELRGQVRVAMEVA